MASRFSAPGRPFHGFAVDGRWTRRVELVPSQLNLPLRWRRPRRIFVNSMSDLFHEALSDEDIATVFGVMAACPQHTFQVLTKRAERMQAFMSRVCADDAEMLRDAGEALAARMGWCHAGEDEWKAPLPNVHLVVSAEDQPRADERIPWLLRTPATVRGVSLEPLLGPVNLGRLVYFRDGYSSPEFQEHSMGRRRLDWIVCGGESGPGARPCDLEWIRSIVRQCREAGVPCFVKQWGSRPFDSAAEPYCVFDSFEQWVDKARSWLGGISGAGTRYKRSESVVCVDTAGRICRNGGDMQRARDSGAFPVRAFPILSMRDRKGGDPAQWGPGDWPREVPR